MNLLLWRHADAGQPFLGEGEREKDFARKLTPKGQRQAKRMADWINDRLAGDALVLASPAVRAQQTAEALKRKFKTEPALSPGAQPIDALDAIGWPQLERPVLLIGHQPTLGQLAAWLIGGEIADWSIKKGAIWWITTRTKEGIGRPQLRAVLHPDWV